MNIIVIGFSIRIHLNNFKMFSLFVKDVKDVEDKHKYLLLILNHSTYEPIYISMCIFILN